VSKPKVLYAPTKPHTKRVFNDETFSRLLERFEVSANPSEKDYTSAELAELIGGYDGLVTGWGTAPLTEEVLEAADRLRIIAHSAGSIKAVLSHQVVSRFILPRGICVFSAREAIALNVAEATVGYMIMASRRVLDHALAFRERGVWRDPSIPANGQFLSGSTVGVVAASKVGREVIRLLKPFDVRVLVYDPYLSDEEAAQLGVVKAGLDTVLSESDFISIHAPMLPQTRGLTGEAELRRLKDGAILVNTSRGPLIDQRALLKEAKSSRLQVVLDVTDPEPPPPDSPLRQLPNVVVTPHISGAGYYGYFKIGSSTLQALEDFFSGRPVKGLVRLEEYPYIA